MRSHMRLQLCLSNPFSHMMLQPQAKRRKSSPRDPLSLLPRFLLLPLSLAKPMGPVVNTQSHPLLQWPRLFQRNAGRWGWTCFSGKVINGKPAFFHVSKDFKSLFLQVVDVVPTLPDIPLPAIQPNYRPLPSIDLTPLSPQRRKGMRFSVL